MFANIFYKLKSSIRYQLFIAYLMVGILIAGLLLVAVISYFSKTLEKTAVQNMKQLNQQIAMNLDTNIYELEKLTLSVYFENQIANFLKKANNPPTQYDRDYYENMNNMSFMISGIIELNKNIHGAYIYNLHGQSIIFANQRNIGHNNQSVREDDWFQLALDKNGRKVLLGSHRNKGVTDDTLVISLARAVIDVATAKNIGVIVVDQKISEIGSIINNVKVGEQGSVIILDENDGLIYCNRPGVYELLAEQPAFFDGLSGKQGDYFQLSVPGDRYHIYHNASYYSNWKVITCIPHTEIINELRGIQRILFLIALFIFGMTFVFSSLIAGKATRSLINLKNMMERFENGELDTQVIVTGHNEISRLEQVFNSMTARIKRLIETQYAETIRRQQTELSILQHQINPHFLYNTLGVIVTQAQAEGAPKVADMIRKLSSIFRYNMGKDGEQVTMDDEITHVKNYIALQKHRFADRILVRYRLSPETMTAILPRMSLQPIIENSIIHCIGQTEGVCVLDIESAILADGTVTLLIRDNGPGIDPDVLEDLNRRFRQTEDASACLRKGEKRGIGFSNVNARIRYLYQGEYGLTLRNVEQGLEVRINIPVTLEKEGCMHAYIDR